MLYLLEVTTISLEVEVNIKVLHDDPLQNVEEAYMLVGDREAEVPIFEIRDMKGRYHTLKACMQHKIDQWLHEAKGISLENRKKVKSTTKGGREVMNRWPESG
jgi:hypothetical protein